MLLDSLLFTLSHLPALLMISDLLFPHFWFYFEEKNSSFLSQYSQMMEYNYYSKVSTVQPKPLLMALVQEIEELLEL